MVYSLENKINIWNEDGAHQVKMLKATLFEFLCRMQDEQCLKNATERFNNLDSNYFNNPNTVNNKWDLKRVKNYLKSAKNIKIVFHQTFVDRSINTTFRIQTTIKNGISLQAFTV